MAYIYEIVEFRLVQGIKIESDQITVLEERKQRLVLEDGLIKLPDPDKILVGWERVYNKFPDTSRAEVDGYLKSCKFRIYREYFT